MGSHAFPDLRFLFVAARGGDLGLKPPRGFEFLRLFVVTPGETLSGAFRGVELSPVPFLCELNVLVLRHRSVIGEGKKR